MTVPTHVQSLGIEAVERYRTAMDAGAGERFAEMVAYQQAPGTQGTDRSFMEGRLDGSWMNAMPPHMARRMVREAQAAGINTSGKFYMGGLADKRAHLDPMAWVDSVADVKRVAQARDLEVRGVVNYTPPDKPPPESKDLADDILRENVKKEMKANPKLKRGEAIEKVKDRMVPHWKKKKKGT